MGSKRLLAPSIARLIHRSHDSATVLDAFAGMCAIGTQLAPRHRVISNDAHAFAAVVARALFTAPGRRPSRKTAQEELLPAFKRNAGRLRDPLARRLDAEKRALLRAERGADWRELRNFTAEDIAVRVPRKLHGLIAPSAYRAARDRTPYALFSMYFASSYFGVRQAMEIDSLRYAIERAEPERRDVYLYALILAVSHCVAAPGHFAQFFVPRDERNTLFIARMRRRSVVDRFWAAFRALQFPRCLDRQGNEAYCSDATALLQSLAAGKRVEDLVIYADPPYSRAQYSRYYHVLETLVRYDYPKASGKGRYRDERFMTDFSRKTQVELAMDEFVEAAAATGAPLYLSYPRNGLLFQHGGALEQILRIHYPRVRVAYTAPLNHSTMGGAPGAQAVTVTEDVYYAYGH
jgi:adenine-specific DNA-methyltransferase